MTLDRTRRLLALRINVLAKGYSGVRAETVEKMLAFLNSNCLSLVPEQGSVGASGDLAPLCTYGCLVLPSASDLLSPAPAVPLRLCVRGALHFVSVSAICAHLLRVASS